VSVFCIPLFHTIYFPLYERNKLHFKSKYGWEDGSFKLYALSAGSAGLFCNVVTNPFWVVRTRMQAEIFRSHKEEHYVRTYVGILHSLNKIYTEVNIPHPLTPNLCAGRSESIVCWTHSFNPRHQSCSNIFPSL
jgi:hypothetical protein